MNKLNGIGVALRFITPLMVGLLLALVSQDMSGRQELRRDIAGIRSSLDNHVSELRKEQGVLRERLARIETNLESLSQRFRVKP